MVRKDAINGSNGNWGYAAVLIWLLVACDSSSGSGSGDNVAPVANDDTFGVDQDQTLTVPAKSGVLSNDTDADGDDLIAVLEAAPSNGTLSLQPDGGFEFSPSAGFAGSASFTYRADDGTEHSDVASVSITVEPITGFPQTNPDSYTIRLNTTLKVDAKLGVLANDTNPSGGQRLVAQGAPPDNGTLTLNLDGSFSYIPDNGFVGPDNFTYVVTQGKFVSPATMVTINVVDNDAPVATDDTLDAIEDTVLILNAANGLLANDSDPDGDTLTAAINKPPSNGGLILNPDGSLAYTPDADYNGTDSFSYIAKDGMFDSNVGIVTINVAGVNDPPVVPLTSNLSVVEGTRTPGLFEATDIEGDPLTIFVTSGPGNGNVEVNSTTRVFFYTPDDAFVGTDIITYIANDGTDDSLEGTINITVSAGTGPAIDSLLPTVGSTGNPLQVFGDQFGTTQGIVTIGGRSATVVIWSANYVSAMVPLDYAPGTYDVVVTDSAARASAPAVYEIVPWLAQTSTHIGTTGATITAVGDGLGSAMGSVSVDGNAAVVNSWDNRSVSFDVPAGPSAGRRPIAFQPGAGAAANVHPLWITGSDMWIPPPRPYGGPASAVWTGTEMFVVGARMGRFNPQFRTWTRVDPSSGPGSPFRPNLVWTGDRVIVWSGAASFWSCPRSGWIYDPTTDQWTAMSDVDAPQGRLEGVVVWTGEEMIVWGGWCGNYGLNTGGRYNPSTDTWTPMTTTDVPQGRRETAGVWTGVEMFIWGGLCGTRPCTDGAMYNPTTDTWRTISDVNAPLDRRRHTAVWTGSEAIVVGGQDENHDMAPGGGRYIPALDAWIPHNVSPNTSLPLVVWSGKEMLLYGGFGTSSSAGTSVGLRYDPVTDTTTPFSNASGLPLGRRDHAVVWTGAELLTWGGRHQWSNVPDDRSQTAAYDPVGDAWWIEGVANHNPRGTTSAMFWTGTEALVLTSLGEHYLYDPATGKWKTTSTVGAPSSGFGNAAWTGTEAVVWNTDPTRRAIYSPSSDEWSPISDVGAPTVNTSSSTSVYVWSGTEVLIWSSVAGASGRYNPVMDTWDTFSQTDAPSSPRRDFTGTWTGTWLVVFGGREGNTGLGDGAAYNPTTDTWTPIASSSPRYSHSAAWTGSNMLVWGGRQDGVTHVDPGELYDPLGDSWTPMAVGPASRSYHAFAFTGTEFLISGGTQNSLGPPFGDGSRYDVASDTWMTLPATDAPLFERYGLWTGNEVLIWGTDEIPGIFHFIP